MKIVLLAIGADNVEPDMFNTTRIPELFGFVFSPLRRWALCWSGRIQSSGECYQWCVHGSCLPVLPLLQNWGHGVEYLHSLSTGKAHTHPKNAGLMDTRVTPCFGWAWTHDWSLADTFCWFCQTKYVLIDALYIIVFSPVPPLSQARLGKPCAM